MSLGKFYRSRERYVHVSKPLVKRRVVVDEALNLHFDILEVTKERGRTLRLYPSGGRTFSRHLVRQIKKGRVPEVAAA